MFPNLIKNAYIKIKPDSNLFCVYKNNAMGAIVINESAKDILSLCDGTHSLEDIISILKNKYSEKENIVAAFVNEFLKPFIDSNIIINKRSDYKTNIIKGSTKVYFPDTITWEITDYCPLKCRHCYLPSKNNKVISKEEIDYILKLIDYMGVYIVQITGGEPLTHPNIEYIIDSLVDKGLTVIVSTSGTYYNDEMFEYLKKLKNVNGSLRISIDGNEDTHNYIRRSNMAFSKSIEFIKKAISNGISCQVATTVINQSKQELEELVAKIRAMGVSIHSIGLVSIQGNAKRNELQTSYNHASLNEFKQYLNSKYETKHFKIQLPQENKFENCGCGYKLIRIRPNLDITPCPMLDLKLGNLNEQSINQIMQNSWSVFYDVCSPGDKKCKGCKLEFICVNCTSNALIGKDLVDKCIWYKSQHENFIQLFE